MTSWNQRAHQYLDKALEHMSFLEYEEGYLLYRKAVLIAAEAEGAEVPDDSNQSMAAALQFLANKLPEQAPQIQNEARYLLVEVDAELIKTVYDEVIFRHLFCIDGHSPDVPELMVIAPRLVQWVERLQAGEEIEPLIETKKAQPRKSAEPPDPFCRHNSPYDPETERYECGKC